MTNRADNFNRSGALVGSTPSDGGSVWLGGNAFTCSGTQAAGSGGSTWTPSVLEASTSAADITATLAAVGNGGLVLRYADANNFLLVQAQATGLWAFRRVAGTFTQIGSTYTGTVSAGATIRAVIDASNALSVYLNGTLRIGPATTTAGSANTKHGIVAFSSSTWDDFVLTDLATGGTAVDPAAGSVTLTGHAPMVARTANAQTAPGAGSLTIAGHAPTVSQPHALTAVAGALALQGFAPSVEQSAAGGVAPGVGGLGLTGHAPTITQPRAFTAGAGALTITGLAPDVTQTSGVRPGAGAITITGLAPSIAQTADAVVTPSAGGISIVGLEPTVTQSGQPTGPTPGGWYFGRSEKRRRYVVQDGERVLVFDTVAQAIRAQEAVNAAQAEQAKRERAAKDAPRRKPAAAPKPVAVDVPKPAQAFTLPALQQLADTYSASSTLSQMQLTHDLQAMAALWQELQDEADDESALLELL